MDRRRRRILRTGALGTLGVLAGCLGGDDSPDGTGETTGESPTREGGTSRDGTDRGGTATTDRSTTRGSPLGTSRTVSGTSVTVEEVAVRDSVIYFPLPDEPAVDNAGGGRYVFVRIRASGDGPDRTAFDLVVGDRRLRRAARFPRPAIVGVGRPYDANSGRGWLGFSVSAPMEAETVRVEAGDAAWAIPDRIVERLRRPTPTFELAEFAVPETVPPDAAIDVSATFRNAGDRAGTVRAALVVRGGGFPCCAGPNTAQSVPAGERRTWTTALGGRGYPDPGSEVDVELHYTGGASGRTVAVDDVATSDGG